ncbi:MAG: HPP family protein [Alphaproteobacteria bacterium]|nr:HPP family protein [Alphaproteobacteria bacterium]
MIDTEMHKPHIRLLKHLRDSRRGAELLAVVYIAVISFSANRFHLFFLLFPELGALAADVLTRPNGAWAREPWKLVITPTATAVVGIVIGRQLPYGVFGILITIALSIGVIFLLRSSVAPAISAGVLPLVLDVKTWLYPLSILFGLCILAVVLFVWKRSGWSKTLLVRHSVETEAIEVLESAPLGKKWLLALLIFTGVVGTIAQFTGLRFILFPPLVVMAYEMFAHPHTCAWAKPPFEFPIACFLAAGVGVALDRWLGVTPVAVAITLGICILVVRAFRLRMPPALSIGLLPFVMAAPTFIYVVSVGIGAAALTGAFVLFQKTLAFPVHRMPAGKSHEKPEIGQFLP